MLPSTAVLQPTKVSSQEILDNLEKVRKRVSMGQEFVPYVLDDAVEIDEEISIVLEKSPTGVEFTSESSTRKRRRSLRILGDQPADASSPPAAHNELAGSREEREKESGNPTQAQSVTPRRSPRISGVNSSTVEGPPTAEESTKEVHVGSGRDDPLHVPRPSTSTSGRVEIPFKPIQKRVEAAIETFVFMDLETTPFTPNLFPKISTTSAPHNFSTELRNILSMEAPRSNVRITEMAFVAVRRKVLEKGIVEMRRKRHGQPQGRSIEERVACSVHSRLIRPTFTDTQWEVYDALQQQEESMKHRREDLEGASYFGWEWRGVYDFLESLPKPVCIVAHNGMTFDFNVLATRLAKAGHLGSPYMGIPEQVWFVDSLLATRHLDELRREEIHRAVVRRNSGTQGSRDDRDVALAKESPLPSSLGDFVRSLQDENTSPAMYRVINKGNCIRIESSTGRIVFDRTASKKESRNSLSELYSDLIGAKYNCHYALDDTHALLQVCLAYGAEFIRYCDEKAAEFPF